MKTAEEMAMEYLGTDPRKRTGETLASLLLLYGAQVREEAAKIYESCTHPRKEMADAIRKMELP